MSVHPITLQQIQTLYWIGLTIGKGDLRKNSTHRNIRKIILGSAGVGRCPGLSNRCTILLADQQARIYISITELELNRFKPLTLGDILWHLSTQVNNSYISSQINFFDLSRGKRRRFIPFLVYALVYPSISSNVVNLATLSPWYESFCTHTCYPFLRKPLLR